MKIGKWNVFVCRKSCDVFKYFNNDKNCYMLIKKLFKCMFIKYLLYIGKFWFIINEGKLWNY